MADKIQIAWRDFDGDRQQVSYDTLEGADGNAIANEFAVQTSAWVAGNLDGYGFFEQLTEPHGSSSANPLAQGALQAIIETVDTVTGRTYNRRLPMPNLAKAQDATQTPPEPAFKKSGNVTVFNELHSDYAPLIASMSAFISPEGNSVTVSRIYIEE